LREICAGDPWEDDPSMLDLGTEEDEAVLILTREPIQRDVLDGRGRLSRPAGVGHRRVRRYRHRRGASGSLIGAGSASVDVVDAFHTRFGQVLHV
jgi:hypothetical protein